MAIVESDEDEDYLPPLAARKVTKKVAPPVRVKAVKHKEEPAQIKIPKPNKKPVPVKTAIVVKTKPKRISGNNV